MSWFLRIYLCLLPEGEFGMLETETPVGGEEPEPEITIKEFQFYKSLSYIFTCETFLATNLTHTTAYANWRCLDSASTGKCQSLSLVDVEAGTNR